MENFPKSVLSSSTSCYSSPRSTFNSSGLFDIQIQKKKEDEIRDISHELLFKKRFWRIEDTASFLQCSVGHIYNLSSRGLIPKIKKGKFLVFIPEQIFEWVIQGD